MTTLNISIKDDFHGKFSSKTIFPPLNPKANCSFHPIVSNKLNPDACVFISQEVIMKHNFSLNISAPPFYPTNFLFDTSRNKNDMAGSCLQPSNLTANNIGKMRSHLNINSVRNKSHLLADVVSETKIDNTFPAPQFYISGFSAPYRLDRSTWGWGLLLYIRNDIPSKLLKCTFCGEIECLAFEINIWKKSGSYMVDIIHRNP